MAVQINVHTQGGVSALLRRLTAVREVSVSPADARRGIRRKWTARCPAHDDRNPSLSIAETTDGRILLHCFAGCLPEQVLQAVGLSWRDLANTGGDGAAVQKAPPLLIRHVDYELRDEQGSLVAIHRRKEFSDGSKKFSWLRPGPDGRLQSGLNGLSPADLPLYGTDRLDRSKPAVILCEGEKTADALLSEGINAVGTVCGAHLCPSDDVLRPLLGFDQIYLWPDNDEPGRRHMVMIGQVLRRLGTRDVRVIEWADAPPGGDAADFVERCGDRTRAELRQLRADAQPFTDWAWAEQTTQVEERAPQPDRSHSKHESQVSRLIKYAQDHFKLFHTPGGEAYLQAASGLCVRLGSAQGRTLLARVFYQTEKRGASTSVITDALPTLEAIARFDGPCHPVHVRLARQGDRIYLDLGDEAARAVEIDASGWRIKSIRELPVRFERPPGLLPLPEPKRGGRWEQLQELLPTDRQGFILAVSWLVGALAGLPAYPVLVFTGPQGSGKTTACRLLAHLIDPQQAQLSAQPRELRDLAIYAQHAHAIVFDNLSSLPQWLSDGLCRLATGSGFRTRRLYTDSDEAVFEAVRPILANGIPDFVRQGDLADRCLPVRLTLMSPERRRRVEDLWVAFERARPALLGLLLDAVSMGLRRQAGVRLPKLPRMADFAQFIGAAAPALPFTAEAFLEAYGAGQAELASTLLEDAFAEAVLEFVDRVGSWEGTAAELLEVLLHHHGLERPPTGWPRTPQGVGQALARLEPALLQVGVVVRRSRTNRCRMISIQKVSNQTSQTSQTSPPDKKAPESPQMGDFAGDVSVTFSDNAQGQTSPHCHAAKEGKSALAGDLSVFSPLGDDGDNGDNYFATFRELKFDEGPDDDGQWIDLFSEDDPPPF
ncbi:MAG: hypothetical protein Q9M35_09275 [Rhodothermus sp.]|nr:hypothetical protein [Rhodothermus sp.]